MNAPLARLPDGSSPAENRIRSLEELGRKYFGRPPVDELARREAIRAFSIATLELIDSHHPETAEHLVRCARYATIIARQYNEHFQVQMVSPERMHNLSLWHDVGKLEIPLAVLDKPGRLDDEERKIINTHCASGAELIDAVCTVAHPAYYEGCALARDIALYHHERWDGAGYPHAARHVGIPLHARIVAVADVLDALVSARTYKRARKISDAIDYIESESGAVFDPQAVAAMLACRGELKSVSVRR